MAPVKNWLKGSLMTALLCSPLTLAQQYDRNKLPEIGAAGFTTLSIEKERNIGSVMMKQVRATQPILEDPALNEYITHLGNALVKNAEDVNYGFTFFVVNNSELNAFAFFGGHIGIHSGLITTAATESELASVIAHEISHVTQRHLARRLEAQNKMQPLSIAGIISGVLLSLINPTVGMAALSTSMAASQQASINYTRGNEQEADRVGIELLSNSGFDPNGAANFFNKMSDRYRYKSKPPAMLLTHPLSEARITDARLRAHNLPRVNLPPSLNFELAKARLKARYQATPKQNIAYYQNQLNNGGYALKEAALYGLAIAFFENKNYQQSNEIMKLLYNNDDKNLFYLDVLADLYLATNKNKQAIDMLEKAHGLKPYNQVVTLNYANVLYESGEYERAQNLLQDFLIVKPGNFIAYDLLTGIYKAQENYAMMHTSKAEVLALLGGFDKAIDELQTAYTYAGDEEITKKRIKARILQLQAQYDRIKRL